jgi:hypothetical protein
VDWRYSSSILDVGSSIRLYADSPARLHGVVRKHRNDFAFWTLVSALASEMVIYLVSET